MTSLCLISATFLYLMLSYDIPKLAIAAPVPNILKCGACRKTYKEFISLEKCGHKLCISILLAKLKSKVCLDNLLKESPAIWQDQNGAQFKISPCPECKEFFRVDVHKIF